jgi:hypothetical protein
LSFAWQQGHMTSTGSDFFTIEVFYATPRPEKQLPGAFGEEAPGKMKIINGREF